MSQHFRTQLRHASKSGILKYNKMLSDKGYRYVAPATTKEALEAIRKAAPKSLTRAQLRPFLWHPDERVVKELLSIKPRRWKRAAEHFAISTIKIRGGLINRDEELWWNPLLDTVSQGRFFTGRGHMWDWVDREGKKWGVTGVRPGDGVITEYRELADRVEKDQKEEKEIDLKPLLEFEDDSLWMLALQTCGKVTDDWVEWALAERAKVVPSIATYGELSPAQVDKILDWAARQVDPTRKVKGTIRKEAYETFRVAREGLGGGSASKHRAMPNEPIEKLMDHFRTWVESREGKESLSMKFNDPTRYLYFSLIALLHRMKAEEVQYCFDNLKPLTLKTVCYIARGANTPVELLRHIALNYGDYKVRQSLSLSSKAMKDPQVAKHLAKSTSRPIHNAIMRESHGEGFRKVVKKAMKDQAPDRFVKRLKQSEKRQLESLDAEDLIPLLKNEMPQVRREAFEVMEDVSSKKQREKGRKR